MKSLVREFDESTNPAASTSTSPPVSPVISVNPSPTSLVPNGHVRRSASISFSSSSVPFNSPSAFVYPHSNSGGLSPDSNLLPSSMVGGGVPKRRVSRELAPIVVTDTDFGLAEGVGLDGVNEDDESPEGLSPTNANERDDIFLPLSPNSAAPYNVTFGSTNTSAASTPMTALSGQSHARKHSRIHERNLSAFFPRPGQQGFGYGDTYEDSQARPQNSRDTVADIQSPAADDIGEDTGRRRGHHARHSISHNLFPVDAKDLYSPSSPFPSSPYDSTQWNLSPLPHNISVSASPLSAQASFGTSSDLPVPSPFIATKYSHLPVPVRVILATLQLTLATQLALVLALAQIVLGGSLWITGQNGESLAVTGLGYLIVFDGMGGLSGVLVEGRAEVDALWASMGSASRTGEIRVPFG